MKMTKKQWSFSKGSQMTQRGFHGGMSLHREVIAKGDASTGVYHWVCIFACLFLGPICSELPGDPFFNNFCTFSLYRCIMKKYFLKVSYLAIS